MNTFANLLATTFFFTPQAFANAECTNARAPASAYCAPLQMTPSLRSDREAQELHEYCIAYFQQIQQAQQVICDYHNATTQEASRIASSGAGAGVNNRDALQIVAAQQESSAQFRTGWADRMRQQRVALQGANENVPGGSYEALRRRLHSARVKGINCFLLERRDNGCGQSAPAALLTGVGDDVSALALETLRQVGGALQASDRWLRGQAGASMNNALEGARRADSLGSQAPAIRELPRGLFESELRAQSKAQRRESQLISNIAGICNQVLAASPRRIGCYLLKGAQLARNESADVNQYRQFQEQKVSSQPAITSGELANQWRQFRRAMPNLEPRLASGNRR